MHSVNEKQVGGTHYKGGIQHWDFTLHILRNRYLEGCITKYVTRFRKKNGMQDLEKAMHYLQKLQESYAQDCIMPLFTGMRYDMQVAAFVQSNDIIATDMTGQRTLVHEFISKITHWSNAEDLEDAVSLLEVVMRHYEEELDHAKKRAAEDGGAISAYVRQGANGVDQPVPLRHMYDKACPIKLYEGTAVQVGRTARVLTEDRETTIAINGCVTHEEAINIAKKVLTLLAESQP